MLSHHSLFVFNRPIFFPQIALYHTLYVSGIAFEGAATNNHARRLQRLRHAHPRQHRFSRN